MHVYKDVNKPKCERYASTVTHWPNAAMKLV